MPVLHYHTAPEDFSDWQALHQLLMDCFSFMEARIDPPSSLNRMTPASLREKADGETLVVVHADSELVGCGFLRETEGTIYLGKIAVRTDQRRRGILREIVTIAEHLADERGKSALELETRIELLENHKTFAALGFEKTAENAHAGYDRPTSITMTKFL